MKRIVRLFFILVCIMSIACGCKSVGSNPVTLEDSISIPKDGKISAAVFEKLQQENKVVTFYGKSEGICYEWTVFGNDIKKAKDLNLGIEIMQADSEKVVFCYLSKENFGFSPVLSIYLDDSWDALSADVCKVSKAGSSKKGQASITEEKKHSILNFTTEEQKGTYEIIPKDAKAARQATPEAVLPATADAVLGEASMQVQEAGNLSSPASLQDGSAARPSGAGSAQAQMDTSAKGEASGTGGQDVAKENVQAGSNISSVQNSVSTGQDQYKTDPVPDGKPLPAEPDSQEVDKRKSYTCTFSIECSSILNHLQDLEEGKLDVLPNNGIILAPQSVTFYEGESVFDVLERVCKEHGIQLEASWTPMYNSAYVEGIQNLYEFDCGSGSGWMYRVSGWYPNYGCSRYQLKQGEVVEWRYTCDLGNDIGGKNAVGN